MEATNEATHSKPRVLKSAVRTPIAVPSTSWYHMSCKSDAARRRKRWSPYSKRNRSFPTKSVSLETLSSTFRNSGVKCVSLNDAFLAPNPVADIEAVDLALECDEVVDEPRNRGLTVADRSALVVCAKWMRAAWSKTREALSEQIYTAENSDLQTKSTMMHVSAMKCQLKDDICRMRERVREINETTALLDELEDEKYKLLSENELLTTKMECLINERDCLNQSLANVNEETKEKEERLEKLANQAMEFKEELTEMKQMKASLDNTLREMMTNVGNGERKLSTLKTLCRNLELAVAEAERALNDWNQRTTDTVTALRTSESQSKAIRTEIRIATDGGKIVHYQLNELRDEVLKRDSVISKLNEKVESTAAQLCAMKSRIEISERNVWQRMRYL